MDTINSDHFTLQEKQFVFAPFIKDSKAPCLTIQGKPIKESLHTFFNSNQLGLPTCSSPLTLLHHRRAQFAYWVEDVVNKMVEENLEKVVLAVPITIPIESFKPADFFKKLEEKYPSAFKSIVYTPQSGLWIGASPEQLLYNDQDGFKTMSLAGTQQKKGNTAPTWSDKEIQEQQLVTDYIQHILSTTLQTDIQPSPTQSIDTGNLWHLMASFSGSSLTADQLEKVLHGIHPTPAIGGIPLQKALDTIKKYEIQSRGYYAGYLGEVGPSEHTKLHVNIRCMQVFNNAATIWVGCGITPDSTPAKEWQEILYKMETLQDLLIPEELE